MDNGVTWKQLITVLDSFPLDPYEAFPSVCVQLSRKIKTAKDNVDQLRNCVSKSINLHRIAFVLSRLHRLDPASILESYEYWMANFKDLEEKIGSSILPDSCDLLACPKKDLEQLLLQVLALLKASKKTILYKFILINNLRNVGWDDTAETITESAVEEINRIACNANDVVYDLKNNTLWTSKKDKNKRIERLIEIANTELAGKL